ncbi:MAG: hypothetical protein ABR920_09470 [Terriglobales bacterium]
MNRTKMKDTLRSRIFRSAATALAAIGMLLAGASTAAAACGPTGQKPLGVVRNLPFFAQPNSQSQQAKDHNNPIVGLWHVNYTDSTGAPFLESFDMWHSDGTEWETANFVPAMGNNCLGVWKQTRPRTVQLNHIGWNFNADGSSAGYFTITATNTVSRKGDTYTGVFDYKLYDVNGNLVGEVTGTIAATRITV